MKIGVTGSTGFVGKNLNAFLRSFQNIKVKNLSHTDSEENLFKAVIDCKFIFHLAGVNRPESETEFFEGNVLFTQRLCKVIQQCGSNCVIVFASSIQALRDNPYGRSKLEAELIIEQFCNKTNGRAAIFRFKNMFGKWCRPNYNSVTATFCHNISHGLPINLANKNTVIELIYIDEVINSLLEVLDKPPNGCEFRNGPRSFKITLGDLEKKIRSFQRFRQTLSIPDYSDDFTRFLYATYLSYIDGADFGYFLNKRVDERGSLTEFLKSKTGGQIFISRTKPGITRGNHFHHSKTEKFLVLEGQAVIRFRRIGEFQVIEHKLDGKDFRVLDIPPGYTHSIENVGKGEMVTLFWSSEIFDPEKPDTHFEKVLCCGDL